jgi:acyl-CoA synthetase (NDP forming)
LKPQDPAPAELMLEHEAAALLQAYGIGYAEHELARTPDEAAAAAARLGFPVVLKVASRDVVHKSDVGGVRLGVLDEAAVRAGFAEVTEATRGRLPDARIEGILVCRQVEGAGAELIVGGLRDQTFGPTIMVGAGGVFAEVLNDVAFGLAPLHIDDAQDMLRGLRAYKTLTGYRDAPPLDVGALASCATRLGDLLVDHPEVVEVDLNPVLALTDGCVAVDARIMTVPRA